MSESALGALIRRDRIVVGAALGALFGVSWLYLVWRARSMAGMGSGGGSDAHSMAGMIMSAQGSAWGWAEVGALAVMWSFMMLAMMTASAAPMVLTFAAVHRRRAEAGRPTVPTALFVAGYLVVWTGFSVLAALVQTGLHAAALLSPAMSARSPWMLGVILLCAGAFQWSPLKRTCLAACRSPVSFLVGCWREGRMGALVMGLRHGTYCLGCCWALMALLFVAGVMNLVWVAALAAFVLVEKVAPRGAVVGRVVGAVLLLVGAAVFAFVPK
jgi:predicted metal-binding membrane protein